MSHAELLITSSKHADADPINNHKYPYTHLYLYSCFYMLSGRNMLNPSLAVLNINPGTC
jgi:hypothetical protein